MTTNSLSKPDDQHRSEQRAESKARHLMQMIWTIYGVVGAITFVFFVWKFGGQCSGLLDCMMVTLKAVVWTVLWPFFWILYGNSAI